MEKAREQILQNVQEVLQEAVCISSARVYGSWLYNERSVDMDVAIMVKSDFGVIDSRHYRALRDLRILLCEKTGQDIDLVPHTDDEFTDRNSPLWYPRYNPSLVFGRNLKGDFLIVPISTSAHSFSFSDLTAYVLYDNRTICRRQLVRSFNGEEDRIFVSKLLHGPGNALTYQSCKHRMDYTIPPSNLEGCFETFDRIYGVDSSLAMAFLHVCKESIDFERGVLLMNWYENLVNMILHGDQFRANYQRLCSLLGER
ncbi:nucleotidyltransferase domain-containing protein [Candidatus Falkowbacteria bacterium]|nr:nucleotidyltransferase domain-containing protein [Candidatus Falkowbacteria bacterium]